MNVSRDVVTDLLPLYLAGEASPDTRTLVEAFFEEDPEFARIARAGTLPTDALVPPRSLTEDDAVRTIRRTRAMIRWRGTILGIAIFLTALPFSVAGGPDGIRWAWQEFPAGAVGAILLAACAWIAYLRVSGRLRTLGA